MNKWTRLAPVPVPAYLSKAAAKEVAAINAQIEQVLTGRGMFDAMQDRLRARPVHEGDAIDYFQADAPRLNRFELQRAELEVRDLIEDYCRDTWHNEATRANGEARAALAKAEADVRAALVKVGYLDLPSHTPSRNKILPSFVLAHPAVERAENAARERRTEAVVAVRTENKARRDEIVAEMEAARARALCGV